MLLIFDLSSCLQVSALGQPSMLKSASAALAERGIAGMWPEEGTPKRPDSSPVDLLQHCLSPEDRIALDRATKRVISLAQTAASLVRRSSWPDPAQDLSVHICFSRSMGP